MVPSLAARDAALQGSLPLHAVRAGCLRLAHVPDAQARLRPLPAGQVLLVSTAPCHPPQPVPAPLTPWPRCFSSVTPLGLAPVAQHERAGRGGRSSYVNQGCGLAQGVGSLGVHGGGHPWLPRLGCTRFSRQGLPALGSV